MMSKVEREVVEQLIRACELCALGATGHRMSAEAAFVAGKKLLPPKQTLYWRLIGVGQWTAAAPSGNYGIVRGPHSRDGFWVSHRDTVLGNLPTLQQAKAYCEQKARS